MPSRALLTRRLHKSSVDTVDRAIRELTVLGAVVVERRREGTRNLTDGYRLRTSDPAAGPVLRAVAGEVEAGPRGDKLDGSTVVEGGGRMRAATPTEAARGSRMDRGRLTADLRPDPEWFTERTTPPPDPRPADDGPLLAAGLNDALLSPADKTNCDKVVARREIRA